MTMRRAYFILVACLAGSLLLAGCANEVKIGKVKGFVPLDKMEIKSRFDRVAITTESIPDAVKDCFDLSLKVARRASAEAIIHWQKDQVAVLVPQTHATQMLFRGGNAVCVPKSERGYFIYAGEALWNTVNVTGVAQEVLDGWYIQVVRLLAEKGSARVLYVFGAGTHKNNALAVQYAMGSGFELNYRYQLLKAGGWDPQGYDFQFSDPQISGYKTVKRSYTGTSQSSETPTTINASTKLYPFEP